MKLLFFQTGNYAEAWHRFASGAPETYRDQRVSVDYVAGLAAAHDVTTLAMCDTPHDQVLAPGLRAIGLPRAALTSAKLRALFDEIAPDLMIARSPHPGVLRIARQRAIPTLPSFADIFDGRGPKARLRHMWLRWLLSGRNVPCIANHSLNASLSIVAALHYPARQTVPWDWSRLQVNAHAKAAIADPAAPTLFYAGALSAEKGVGDCIEAVALLHQQGCKARLSLAGGGDIAPWAARAESLGVAPAVTFLGLVPNTEVRDRMAAHDMVIVPSRHSYPEGLPNTIYEGLASRSPLILSDHPAFAGRVPHGSGGMTFRAADPRSLADCISQLAQTPQLYRTLSENAESTLNRLYIGVEWSALVDQFLADPGNRTGWVAPLSLAAITAAAEKNAGRAEGSPL